MDDKPFHARNYVEAARHVEGTTYSGRGMRSIQRVGRGLWRIAEVFTDDILDHDAPLTLSERWENIKETWRLK